MYDAELAKEWSDWADAEHPSGTRELEIVPFLKNWVKSAKMVVDIGCGQGYYSACIAPSTEYIGVEPSVTLLNHAREKYSNRKFIGGSAYGVPLDDSCTDSVISIWVWSHLENLKKASEEMFRILQPNGRFLVITASPDTYEERKTFYDNYNIDGNCLTGSFSLGGSAKLSNTTLYLHTKDHILGAIKDSGLVIDQVGKMGKSASSDLGLYIVIEGRKIV